MIDRIFYTASEAADSVLWHTLGVAQATRRTTKVAIALSAALGVESALITW